MLLNRGCPPMSQIWGQRSPYIHEQTRHWLLITWFFLKNDWSTDISSLIPLLSRCLLWPSAYWNRLWESYPHWNGLTGGGKCKTNSIGQVNNSCHTDTLSQKSQHWHLCNLPPPRCSLNGWKHALCSMSTQDKNIKNIFLELPDCFATFRKNSST